MRNNPRFTVVCFQVLFSQIVLAFPTVNHGNLVCLGLSAYAAAESPGRAQVMVVEGLI
jgi:hypothetical protein